MTRDEIQVQTPIRASDGVARASLTTVADQLRTELGRMLGAAGISVEIIEQSDPLRLRVARLPGEQLPQAWAATRDFITVRRLDWAIDDDGSTTRS